MSIPPGRKISTVSQPIADHLCVLDTVKIRALREARGWSMADAAKAAGFTGRAQWYDVESGRKPNVTLETLGKIADALGVDPRELLAPRQR